MRYFLDTAYLEDYKFPDIIKVTLLALIKEKDEYEGRIICPKNKNIELIKSGVINDDIEAFTQNILKWIFDSSIIEELFYLCIFREGKLNKRTIFKHDDDTCCWFLDLSENEYTKFCANLKNLNYPIDLFYKKSELIISRADGLLGHLGFKKHILPINIKKSK